MSEVILVTGFGPFRDHNINASWEAVKLLPDEIEEFEIKKQQIPVTYDHVQKDIPSLWKELNPINQVCPWISGEFVLVIHVGVSSFANKLILEQSANRTGYLQMDGTGQLHPSGYVCCDGDDCISTDIDVHEICNFMNSFKDVKASVSTNAGRYLCEFIYYTSLHIDRTKTLFIHVPPLDKPYSDQELSNGLLEVIKSALKQIKNKLVLKTDTAECSCSIPVH